MPTGINNASGAMANIDSAVTRQSVNRAAINRSTKILFAADNVPTPVPHMFVPGYTSVYIRAHNGTPTGNSEPVLVATYPEGLTAGRGDVITPDTEITFPVDNTGQIWAQGKAGDGVIVSIRAANTQ